MLTLLTATTLYSFRIFILRIQLICLAAGNPFDQSNLSPARSTLKRLARGIRNFDHFRNRKNQMRSAAEIGLNSRKRRHIYNYCKLFWITITYLIQKNYSISNRGSGTMPDNTYSTIWAPLSVRRNVPTGRLSPSPTFNMHS